MEETETPEKLTIPNGEHVSEVEDDDKPADENVSNKDEQEEQEDQEDQEEQEEQEERL